MLGISRVCHWLCNGMTKPSLAVISLLVRSLDVIQFVYQFQCLQKQLCDICVYILYWHWHIFTCTHQKHMQISRNLGCPKNLCRPFADLSSGWTTSCWGAQGPTMRPRASVDLQPQLRPQPPRISSRKGSHSCMLGIKHHGFSQSIHLWADEIFGLEVYQIRWVQLRLRDFTSCTARVDWYFPQTFLSSSAGADRSESLEDDVCRNRLN